jgi:hypothetical protein
VLIKANASTGLAGFGAVSEHEAGVFVAAAD